MAANPKKRVTNVCYRHKLPTGGWQITWRDPDTNETKEHVLWGEDWSYTWAFDRFDQVITK